MKMNFAPLGSPLKSTYRIAQNGGGENFGEFGKSNVIHQYFTQPNSRSTEVAKGYSLNSPKFPPLPFCAIR